MLFRLAGRRVRRIFRGRSHRGQSVVEFALLVPVFLLIMVMALDFGRVFLGWVNVNNMARIGANFAALNPTAWQGAGDPVVQAKYREVMTNDARANGCTLPNPLPPPSFPDAAPNTYELGSRAQVTITCQFGLLTPLVGNIVGNPLPVTASAIFPIRSGSVAGVPVGTTPPTPTAAPTASPSPTPSPTPTPTASPTPTATLPGATPGPTPTPTPTLPPIDYVASFYGTPTETGYDATSRIGPHSQGGGAGSTQVVVAWNGNVPIAWTNTSTGGYTSCSWSFGSGSSPTTRTLCAGGSSTYSQIGTYTVTLTLNGPGGTAPAATFTVVSTCQVPDFHGLHTSEAAALWSASGFTGAVTIQGNGNFKINNQSWTSGLLTPTGGCAASITVGP